jgi:hypothetical protein
MSRTAWKLERAMQSTGANMAEEWRKLGDTTPEVMAYEFRRLKSDLEPLAGELHAAMSPHTNLGMAMLAAEQTYWTYHNIIPKGYNNPFSLTDPWDDSKGGRQWSKFSSPVEGAKAWRARMLSTTGPYANTRTIPELISVYAPGFDGNDEAAYVRKILTYRDSYKALEARLNPGGGGGTKPPTVKLNFDTVIPFPPMQVRLITHKPAGQGWDNLGQREAWGGVMHRMQGTLWGTDGHFRGPVGALTDYGIDSITGEMLQWCDPWGWLTPWASGPVSSPYGDGASFVSKFGSSAVNKFLASLEFSGYFRQPGSSVTADTPLSDIAIRRAGQWLAAIAQRAKIPFTDFPIRPDWLFSAVFWHQEFTLGTGKICPGDVIMNATTEIIEVARQMLQKAQTGVDNTPPIVVVPPIIPGNPPAPAIRYPAGLNRDLAIRLFGELKAPNGAVYRFDETGPVSVAWLTEGSKDGEYGELVNIIQSPDGPYFRFSDGLLLYKPKNAGGAYRPVGVGDPEPADAEQPKVAA